jgi:cytochrome c oxidase subunit 2
MNRTQGAIALIVIFLMAALAAMAFAAAPAAQQEQVIKITAKKFEYSPNVIKIKKGVPVVFEFTSLDRVHGFTVPDLDNVRLTIEPGKANRVTIMAPKAGTYEFHCDLFCGDGHEGMTGTILVED